MIYHPSQWKNKHTWVLAAPPFGAMHPGLGEHTCVPELSVPGTNNTLEDSTARDGHADQTPGCVRAAHFLDKRLQPWAPQVWKLATAQQDWVPWAWREPGHCGDSAEQCCPTKAQYQPHRWQFLAATF